MHTGSGQRRMTSESTVLVAAVLLVVAGLAGPAAGETKAGAVSEADQGAQPLDLDTGDPGGQGPGGRNPGGLPPRVPRPEFMSRKPELPDFMLREKREGSYVTILPAISSDPDTGVMVGGFVEFYQNGSEQDPFFRTAPYRRKIFAGGVVGSEGFLRAIAELDQPYIGDSRWRIRGTVGIEADTAANYFGQGEELHGRLRLPGSGSFDSLDSYYDAGNVLLDDGTTFARFAEYKNTRLWARGTAEMDTLGGLLRPLIGLTLSWTDVEDYTRDLVATDSSQDGVQRPTALFRDCLKGVALYCGGGWDNFLKLGLVWDSRDFEPDPRRGILAELTTELASKRSWEPRTTTAG